MNIFSDLLVCNSIPSDVGAHLLKTLRRATFL